MELIFLRVETFVVHRSSAEVFRFSCPKVKLDEQELVLFSNLWEYVSNSWIISSMGCVCMFVVYKYGNSSSIPKSGASNLFN